MKKLILISAIAVAVLSGLIQIAFAVPAAPIIHTLDQADGAKFQARMWGDEWQHGWETVEGYTIVHDKATRNWVYAVTDNNGMLVASPLVVGKSMPLSSAPMHPRSVDKSQAKNLGVRASGASPAPSPPQKVVSPAGVANIPIILVNFSDTSTTYTTGNFTTLLFGNGTNSMKDYYEEVSQGGFSISPGPSGIVGWYTAVNGHDYYGENDILFGRDMWPGDLVYEAVVAADAAVDFSAYDSDGDCYVDVVGIVHQGTGEESGPTTDIWSHKWSLSGAQFWGYSNYGAYTTGDTDASCTGGYIVNKYITMPELYNSTAISTIGVFAHEYGHALGLPDLYDTDYSSEGIGTWGIMASGSWLGTPGGSSPAHMSAWSKYFLGWVNPVKVTTSLLNEQINRSEIYDDVYMLLDNPGDSPGNLDWNSSGDGTGEYFLVENRRKTGFDEALPEEGLLIWHVDESKGNNENKSHYLVALEQSDGFFDLENNTNTGDSGDPWAFTATGFTEVTTPNTALYNESLTGVRVTDISASAAVMTANLIVDWPPPVLTLVDPTPQNNSNLNRNYVFVNVTASETLSTALLEWNGTNETMSSGSWYKNETELADGTYTFKVWGNDLGGNWNVTETRVVNIDTTAPTITIYSPTNTTTNDTTPLLNVTFGEDVNTTWYNNGTTDSVHYYGVSNLTLNLTTLEEGPHNITVYANDSLGNLNHTTVFFIVDTQPPEINITNPVNGATIKVFDNTVRGTVFDTVFTIYKVNITGNGTGTIEVDVTNGEFSYDISYVNGSNTIVVNATDEAGHVGSANVTVTVIKELQLNVSTDASGAYMWDVNAGDMDVRINLSTGNQAVNGTMNITAHALASDVGSSVMDANTGSWGTHLGKFFEINVSDNLNETDGNLSWAEMRVYYLQEEVNAAKLTEDSLALYWDNGSTWKKLGNQSWVHNTSINTTGAAEYSGYVWANLSHFSTYSVAGRYRANLIVDNITFSDSSPTEGNSITINATVHNTNATDAGNFTVELLVDGNPLANNTLLVKSNSTNTTQFNWTSTNGTHNITIVADAGGVIAEVNETNNNATEQMTVKTKADLTVSNITFSDSSPTDGDVITINATVSNNGETDAEVFIVGFLVGGAQQANDTLSVEANSTNTTQFTWTSVQGTHNVTIVADADNAINESNETNNNATEQVTVQAKQTPPSGGGGGGGGGSSKTISKYIKNIAPGETDSVAFDSSKSPYITEIAITVSAKVYNAKISLETLDKKPSPFFSDPADLVLSYLKITKANVPIGALEKADIKFMVEKEWLKENDINKDAVALSREVNKEWEKLPTVRQEEGPEHVYYSAETPGFSFFVITGDKGSGYVEEAPVETEIPAATLLSKSEEVPPAEEVETEPPTPTTPPEAKGKQGAIMVGAAILVLLAISTALYFKSKPKT